MATTIFKTLLDKYKKAMGNQRSSVRRSQEWFRDAASDILDISGNEIMGSDKKRRRGVPGRKTRKTEEGLAPVKNLTPRHTGRMVMYFYDPKWKDILPHYDMFPLVLPIKFYNDGFLGLNLHYLPPDLRAKFLDGIYTVYKDAYMDERRKLNITYQMLNNSRRHRFFKPCVHRYLYKQVRSSFFLVDPEEWDVMLTLPTERFVGDSKEKVWQIARDKLNVRKS